jgi:hypothetical protein
MQPFHMLLEFGNLGKILDSQLREEGIRLYAFVQKDIHLGAMELEGAFGLPDVQDDRTLRGLGILLSYQKDSRLLEVLLRTVATPELKAVLFVFVNNQYVTIIVAPKVAKCFPYAVKPLLGKVRLDTRHADYGVETYVLLLEFPHQSIEELCFFLSDWPKNKRAAALHQKDPIAGLADKPFGLRVVVGPLTFATHAP